MSSHLDERGRERRGRQAVDEMIALQRRIFERQRRIIEGSEAHATRGFTRYRNEYRRAVSGYMAESGFGALCDATARAGVAYVADYHTLRLAQRTFVKLLTAVSQQVDSICLALELVRIEHQEAIDRFLAGRLSEQRFLARIRYREIWPYDIWQNFKPIFDLALDQGFPVIGLDTDSDLPLPRRDRLAAEAIAKAAARYPEATIFVLAGQMHVAPPHLPAAVDRAFVRAGLAPPERVIVYQNAEEIYWQLAAARREDVDVVQIDRESFCVNNTPPLVQQLSYLHWVELDEELVEYGELEATVRSLIGHLGRFLEVPYLEAASAVRVLLPGDLDLVATLEGSNLGEREKRQLLGQVESVESACLPALGAVYLATLSINHAAEESAHFLKAYVSGAEAPCDLEDRFYFTVLNEAVGFFGSKVVNPKRKTDHPGKLRKVVAQARKRGSRPTPFEAAAEYALEHLAWEQGSRAKRHKARLLADPRVFHAAAHVIGYPLGDRLYYALTTGLVAKDAIRELFLARLDGPGEALAAYLSLVAAVRDVQIPRRI